MPYVIIEGILGVKLLPIYVYIYNYTLIYGQMKQQKWEEPEKRREEERRSEKRTSQKKKYQRARKGRKVMTSRKTLCFPNVLWFRRVEK